MQDTDYMIKQGWMVTRLHLTGNALEIYALVYGYTKDGETWYETNKKNICEWLLCSERTVQSHLKDLEDAEYLERKPSKFGRSTKLYLRVNPEIVSRAIKGEEFSPLKREKQTTQKGETFSIKGENNDITPLYIYLNNNIKIILPRACAREEEEKELYKIFFFREAADPAAEARDFLNWNHGKTPEWDSMDAARKYYFATRWEIKHGIRQAGQRWLEAWALIYNWAQQNDTAAVGMLLNPLFFGKSFTDDGVRSYLFRVSWDVRKWLVDSHQQEVMIPFLGPLVEGIDRNNINWKYV